MAKLPESGGRSSTQDPHSFQEAQTWPRLLMCLSALTHPCLFPHPAHACTHTPPLSLFRCPSSSPTLPLPCLCLCLCLACPLVMPLRRKPSLPAPCIQQQDWLEGPGRPPPSPPHTCDFRKVDTWLVPASDRHASNHIDVVCLPVPSLCTPAP